jgi:phospholipase C
MSINRRQFMRRAAGAVSTAAVMGVAGSQRVAGQEQALPAPEASGIEHIVVVMMENRSFDHLLGWLPGANGTQAASAMSTTVVRLTPPIASAPS